MMAPQYERARVLSIALDEAVSLLDDPIDEIAIEGNRIRVRAGGKEITGTYGYNNALDTGGSPMAGSGRWWVKF